jgi:hypothetical protein
LGLLESGSGVNSSESTWEIECERDMNLRYSLKISAWLSLTWMLEFGMESWWMAMTEVLKVGWSGTNQECRVWQGKKMNQPEIGVLWYVEEKLGISIDINDAGYMNISV